MGGDEKENDNIPKVVSERGAEVFYRLVNLYWPERLLGVNKGFMARSRDSLPELLAVVLLRAVVADVGSRCGAFNVSYHREKPHGKS